MLFKTFISRIGYLLKAAFLFAFRGGVFLGALTLILGGFAAFASISIVESGSLFGVLLMALPMAVVGSVLGVLVGAIAGSIIGLVTEDYFYVILRKLDDFVFSIAMHGVEKKSAGLLWCFGGILGSVLGLAAASFLGILENQDKFLAIMWATGGAFVCSLITISITWKIEQTK
jgi:hypothetical protein